MVRKNISFVCIILIFALISMFTACSFGGQENVTDTLPSNNDTGNEEVYQGNKIEESDYVDQTYSDNAPDFAALYEQTEKSVVTVKVSYTYKTGLGVNTSSNTGTGVILNDDGNILTATSLFLFKINANSGYLIDGYTNSLISDYKYEVILYDGSVYNANWVCSDAEYSGGIFSRSMKAFNSDLTIIDIDAEEQLQPASFADSETLIYGQDCYTISTFSDEDDDLRGIMAEGIISKPVSDRESSFYSISYGFGGKMQAVPFFDGSFDYLIQTSITLNNGNAGAPLFNEEGKVVGIINILAESTYVQQSNASFGISFAIPSSKISNFLYENNIFDVVIPVSEHASQNIIAASEEIKTIKSSSDQRINQFTEEFAVVDSEYSDNIVLSDNSGESEITDLSVSEKIAYTNMSKTLKIIVGFYDSSNQLSGSEGSGFIVSKDGYVVTNLHVINKDSQTNEEKGQNANSTVNIDVVIFALFDNGYIGDKQAAFEMEIIAYDAKEDMAVLKFKNSFSYTENGKVLNGFENICTINLKTLSGGEHAVAIGNALGYGLSVTNGIVSVPNSEIYLSEYGHTFIQTDCLINSGNSGGPLYDSSGNLIGINSMGLNTDVSPGYENVSWAIPSEYLVKFLKEVNAGFVSDGKIVNDLSSQIIFSTIE